MTSEEIAQSAADLATVEQLRADNARLVQALAAALSIVNGWSIDTQEVGFCTLAEDMRPRIAEAREIRAMDHPGVGLLARLHAAEGRAKAAETDLAALRQMEEVDRLLDHVSVVELDNLQARVNDTLIPQIARMLAVMLIKEDGTFYNVISWAIGTVGELGPLELLLQREQGKTPTMLRIEAEERREKAEKDADYWRVRAQDTLTSLHEAERERDQAIADNAALLTILRELDYSDSGRAQRLLGQVQAAEHPGRALMAQLTEQFYAADDVVRVARRGFGTSEDFARAEAFDPNMLTRAIERYDAALKDGAK